MPAIVLEVARRCQWFSRPRDYFKARQAVSHAIDASQSLLYKGWVAIIVPNSSSTISSRLTMHPAQEPDRPDSPPIIAQPVETASSPSEDCMVFRRRQVTARRSFLDRELQREPVHAVGLSPSHESPTVSNDIEPLCNESPSVWNPITSEPLPGLTAQLTSHIARLSIGSRMVRLDVSLILEALKQRVEADASDKVNVSPTYREPFERMLWTVMIAGQPSTPIPAGSLPAFDVPPIKPISSICTSLVYSLPTKLKINELDTYLVRTEALLRHYPIPPTLLMNLGEIASEINGCVSSRLMGTRGIWSFNKCYRGTLIILRWWAATTPEIMMEYRTALSEQATDKHLRTTLRGELREALMISPRDEWNLDLTIRRGIEEVATFRRRLCVAVSNEFDTVVEQARTKYARSEGSRSSF